MASRVQAKNTADGSQASVTFDSDVVAGRLIVVFLRVSTGDGTPTGLTDSVGTTYAQIGSAISISGGDGYLYWGAAGGSGSNTISIGGGATARIQAEEVSGLTSPTTDATAQATGTSSAAASGSITAAANSWVFAGLILTSYPSVAVTAGSGFTSINLADGNKYNAEDQNFAAGGSVNGQFTLPESNTWGAIVASFKGAGPSTVLPALLATVTRRIGA